ncbi:probable quinone oxidoreductase [Salvia splendens]|uniref:probable quinone oxidoreductase n=1 Tax=Salvia splendens TaxID=180675 RepID=UPI001C25BF5C|nr:probable quinone oxidoreductase [Salvia splendens]
MVICVCDGKLGAAGGVGVSPVQIGKIRGATVIAVARGSEKVRFFKSLGVDHVVDLSNEDMTQSVKGFLTARKLKGVDVLYDPVGGKLTKDSLKLLNWGEQILIIGFASGEVPAQQISLLLRTGQFMNCTGGAIGYIDRVFSKIHSRNCCLGWLMAY